MMYTNIWYVAEFSKELGEKPVQLRMLGRDFVLFRTESGEPACLSNVCPHRGSSLARGKCEAGTISCPFHGWQFDAGGRCVEFRRKRIRMGIFPPAPKSTLIQPWKRTG